MHNKLKNIAAELNALADELIITEPHCPAEICAEAAAPCETADGAETCAGENAANCQTQSKSNFSPKGPNLQMPFKIPGLGNLFGGNMLGGLFGGLPNMNNLPKTMEELQQNPQMLQMLQNLPNNPQLLNAVSQLGGVDKEQILSALSGLSGDAAPTPPTVTVAAPPPGIPHWQPESLSLKRGCAGGDPLERLLTRWHWRH